MEKPLDIYDIRDLEGASVVIRYSSSYCLKFEHQGRVIVVEAKTYYGQLALDIKEEINEEIEQA